MQETQVWSLGQEDPPKNEMAIHSSTVVWEVPQTEEPGGLQSTGVTTVEHNLVTKPHTTTIPMQASCGY